MKLLKSFISLINSKMDQKGLWIFWFILLSIGNSSSQEVESITDSKEEESTQNDYEESTQSNSKRSFYQSEILQPTSSQARSYYSNPFQPNYPLLAEVSPINEKYEQIGNSFISYIYPTSGINSMFYPYYNVLCRKDKENQKYAESLVNNHLSPLTDKMKDLSAKMKELSNLLSETNKKQPIVPESSFPFKPEENPGDWNELMPFTHNTPDKNVFAEEAHATPEERLPPVSIPNRDDAPNNVNTQSNIFQCDGLLCPPNTIECKITEHAMEPLYEEVLKTIFCLSSDKTVLLKDDKITEHKNKGSSLNTSKTFSKNSGKPIQQDIQNGFTNQFKGFDEKFFNKFKNMKMKNYL